MTSYSTLVMKFGGSMICSSSNATTTEIWVNVLVASAQTWNEQIRTEADIAALAANGPGAQLSRAEAAHDAALRQRASQWEVAYRLIAQAALAATR